MLTDISVKETYSWEGDLMKIRQEIIKELDSARLSAICNHYGCDLSEFHEWMKQRRKLVHVQKAGAEATNLDKIKELTAEELADWIYNAVDDFPPWCDESRGHHSETGGCEKCMVEWLKEEVDDDECRQDQSDDLR